MKKKRWLMLAAFALTSCESDQHRTIDPEIDNWASKRPVDLTPATEAQGIQLSCGGKYNPLNTDEPIFSKTGFVCYVQLKDSQAEPRAVTLVATAVAAHGEELGRSREKVVFDREGRPIHFKFDPPLDFERVVQYVVDVEPY